MKHISSTYDDDDAGNVDFTFSKFVSHRKITYLLLFDFHNNFQSILSTMDECWRIVIETFSGVGFFSVVFFIGYIQSILESIYGFTQSFCQ